MSIDGKSISPCPQPGIITSRREFLARTGTGFGMMALAGLTHAERNGHHYVDGFANTPADEAQAFLAAHPDLYENSSDGVRLAVRDGTLSTRSLFTNGFACAVPPGRIGPQVSHQRIQEHQT